MSIPGDRATLDADGTLRLFGRDSLVVNTGGEKVFVEEVEAVLRGHPAVSPMRWWSAGPVSGGAKRWWRWSRSNPDPTETAESLRALLHELVWPVSRLPRR